MRSMTIENEGDSVVAMFLERSISDEVRIMEIGDELTEMASKMSAEQKLILDFQKVEYCSSAMIGQLVLLRNATERDGVNLRLRNVSPTIQTIFQTMRLDKVFRFDKPDA
ncbi:MAG: STAS domain-containing protein [Planctomycetaceae bacterium]|nr:STAS domain-containing protein [Planctomycetales bacterium]MCB9922960.1 STAS domain-containing protein [Planctomycetaceae bacterium]